MDDGGVENQAPNCINYDPIAWGYRRIRLGGWGFWGFSNLFIGVQMDNRHAHPLPIPIDRVLITENNVVEEYHYAIVRVCFVDWREIARENCHR